MNELNTYEETKLTPEEMKERDEQFIKSLVKKYTSRNLLRKNKKSKSKAKRDKKSNGCGCK